ncbi:hypothetical protein BLOT_013180 [Blomia tropicalis]|nr:hypothetical protein BLOT_013180 [Blomia tropicalis]
MQNISAITRISLDRLADMAKDNIAFSNLVAYIVNIINNENFYAYFDVDFYFDANCGGPHCQNLPIAGDNLPLASMKHLDS